MEEQKQTSLQGFGLKIALGGRMGLKSKDIVDNLISKNDFLKAGETILPGGRISRGFYGTEVEKKIISNQKIPCLPP